MWAGCTGVGVLLAHPALLAPVGQANPSGEGLRGVRSKEQKKGEERGRLTRSECPWHLVKDHRKGAPEKI